MILTDFFQSFQLHLMVFISWVCSESVVMEMDQLLMRDRRSILRSHDDKWANSTTTEQTTVDLLMRTMRYSWKLWKKLVELELRQETIMLPWSWPVSYELCLSFQLILFIFLQVCTMKSHAASATSSSCQQNVYDWCVLVWLSYEEVRSLTHSFSWTHGLKDRADNTVQHKKTVIFIILSAN